MLEITVQKFWRHHKDVLGIDAGILSGVKVLAVTLPGIKVIDQRLAVVGEIKGVELLELLKFLRLRGHLKLLGGGAVVAERCREHDLFLNRLGHRHRRKSN